MLSEKGLLILKNLNYNHKQKQTISIFFMKDLWGGILLYNELLYDSTFSVGHIHQHIVFQCNRIIKNIKSIG